MEALLANVGGSANAGGGGIGAESVSSPMWNARTWPLSNTIVAHSCTTRSPLDESLESVNSMLASLIALPDDDELLTLISYAACTRRALSRSCRSSGGKSSSCSTDFLRDISCLLAQNAVSCSNVGAYGGGAGAPGTAAFWLNSCSLFFLLSQNAVS